MQDSRLKWHLVRTLKDDSEGGGGSGSTGLDAPKAGEGDGGDDPDEDAPDDDPDDDEDADKLADPGKQALDRMKGKWHAERTRARELQRKLDAAENKNEDPKDAERAAKVNRRILRAEIKAAAKGKLSDPTDAFNFLNLDDFEVDDDGDVDEDEIADAIEKLVKNKPYLAAQGGRFAGGGDGGPRKEAKRPRQLTQEDLRKMTPQQIHDAKAAGQLADLLKNPR